MLKVSDALWALAIIALVVGVVLMLSVVLQNKDDLDRDDKVNNNRSYLFLILAAVLVLFVLAQQRYEAGQWLKQNVLSM